MILVRTYVCTHGVINQVEYLHRVPKMQERPVWSREVLVSQVSGSSIKLPFD